MLRKFISLKRIGRFHNYDASGDTTLCPYTLISGANGSGKTTLCAILRSLKSGDPDHINGRRTLGSLDFPEAVLRLSESNTNFDGSKWTNTYPQLEIFDDSFVSENVHSGEEVDINHRRNLYHVIIGEKGVNLAREETELAEQSLGMTKEITAAQKTIKSHLPETMTLDNFISLPEVSDIDRKIAASEAALNLAMQAKRIVERPSLTEINLPVMPVGFVSLLARTLEDIGDEAERQISNHLESHNMSMDGGNWLAQGLGYSDNGNCPFCGQDIDGLPIVAAYRAVFGERYKKHRAEIESMQSRIIELFGDTAIEKLNVSTEQKKSGVEFWSDRVRFEAETLELPKDTSKHLRELGQAALNLIAKKILNPLEPIQLDTSFESALKAYNEAEPSVRKVAKATSRFNSLIEDVKKEAATSEIGQVQEEISLLKATKIRYKSDVNEMCEQLFILLKQKECVDEKKNDRRKQLDEHTKKVIEPYEEKINSYLTAFNARFRIAQTKHNYLGGKAASIYQLVVNNQIVELGSAATPREQPSFRNTLSLGDRMTLALAFFLAFLHYDTELATKTVVFDDPFTSQDAFRRRQTVHEIVKIARSCRQVIVLSHDITFLEQVWDKAPKSERVALSLDAGGVHESIITPLDLKKACQGRTQQDIDDLQAYLNNGQNTGQGRLNDIRRKMRVVLETFLRTHYPTSFQANEWLGDMIAKIRDLGEQHPAWHLYDELEPINDYGSPSHHGVSVSEAKSDTIDPQELSGFVGRTLALVNAVQA